MGLHNLLRWLRGRRTPAWDRASEPSWGPLRFDSALRTAAQLMDISPHPSQVQTDLPAGETGTAA